MKHRHVTDVTAGLMDLGHIVAIEDAHATVGMFLGGNKADGVKSGQTIPVIYGEIHCFQKIGGFGINHQSQQQ